MHTRGSARTGSRRTSSMAWAAALAGLLHAGCLEATPCPESACPDGADPESSWDEQRRLSLPTGTMLELGIEMAEGDVIEVEFTSDGPPVVWNLHSHDGTERPRQAEGRATADRLWLTAPHDGEFWSLWTNDRSETVEVEVRFRLDDGSSLRGWRDEI